MQFWGEFRELSQAGNAQASDSGDEVLEFLSNPVCGDEVALLLSLNNGRISSFQYRAKGCWPVFGCLQLLKSLFVDRPVEDCLTFSLEDFLDSVDNVPVSKRHAFSLTHRALRRAAVTALEKNLDLRPGSVGSGSKERV